jgi:hypothetical protein
VLFKKISARAGPAAAVSSLVSAGVPVKFAAATPFFTGGYQDCGSIPGVNDVVMAPNGPADCYEPNGVFDWHNWIEVSRSSVHPNGTGTDRYALAFQSVL